MTIIGLDDTDSRTSGGCTTYLAARLARDVETAGGSVERTLLVRLNPAVEHKTRGNAALALHCDLDPETALDLAADAVTDAETDDPKTNPGAVVAEFDPGAASRTDSRTDTGEISDAVADFSRRAVEAMLDPEAARETIESEGFATREAGNGRGLVGALAAVGAWRATEDWTYETIAYRERDRWGTPRSVDRESVFEAAAAGYPTVWDTVDRVEDTAVCVPRTPGPVLFGIRGDDPTAVEEVSAAIESEPVALRHTFRTNQGTDAHLRNGTLGDLAEGRSYRVDGTVLDRPETREGGHVFFALGPPATSDGGNAHAAVADLDAGVRETEGGVEGTDAPTRRCVGFEPTKRFRDRVRALRPGDRITVCGEVADGTIKLEKFAVRNLVETEPANPTCEECGRSMESAGADQGYRCRDCGTTADGVAERALDREVEIGWYEVPPVARRHVAKPLIRGGFDAPTHPER